MLNFVEIEPGYGVNGLGIVEIEPGYGVNGAYPDYGQMYGADGVSLVGSGIGGYDDVTLVGAGMGAYDDVTLVGDEDENPFYKKPIVVGGIVAGVLAVALGGYYMMRA